MGWTENLTKNGEIPEEADRSHSDRLFCTRFLGPVRTTVTKFIDTLGMDTAYCGGREKPKENMNYSKYQDFTANAKVDATQYDRMIKFASVSKRNADELVKLMEKLTVFENLDPDVDVVYRDAMESTPHDVGIFAPLIWSLDNEKQNELYEVLWRASYSS